MEKEQLNMINYVLMMDLENNLKINILKVLVAQFLLDFSESPKDALKKILKSCGINVELPREG